jgi:alkaline phosphatase
MLGAALLGSAWSPARAGGEVILGGGWDKFLPRREEEVRAPAPAGPRALAGAAASLESSLGAAGSLGASGGGAGLGALGRSALALPFVALAEDYARLSGTRKDRRDLLKEMRERGYRVIHTNAELASARDGPPRKLMGLFSVGPMPRRSQGRTPSLSAMAHAALALLAQSPRGFFLMVEGSQVDWGGHDNDADYAMHEAADFDDAVGEVCQFLADRGLAGETLVLVTADHETGGLSINDHPTLPLGFQAKWTTKSHSAIPVPVFSFGPRGRDFAGFQTHAGIGRKLIEALIDAKMEWKYPERK